MEIKFLGTGSSSGTPIPGCNCSICSSKKKRNKRMRPSILVNYSEKNILIDTSPELRLQFIDNEINSVDALLFTHCHADHVYGLDDMRKFSMNKRINVYGSNKTLNEVKELFAYIFKKTAKGGGKPRLKLNQISKEFTLFGEKITPLPVFHGNSKIFGYRIGDFAYISDCSKIPNSTFKLLNGLKVLVLDALRKEPHSTHFSLSEAIDAASRIGATKTWFTHIGHSMEHYATNKGLPASMRLAYDSLAVEC